MECGALVRVLLGYGKKGRPIYLKRYDPITKHNVTLNFSPEYAPDATKSADAQADLPLQEEGAAL